jgi:hypothetical protein
MAALLLSGSGALSRFLHDPSEVVHDALSVVVSSLHPRALPLCSLMGTLCCAPARAARIFNAAALGGDGRAPASHLAVWCSARSSQCGGVEIPVLPRAAARVVPRELRAKQAQALLRSAVGAAPPVCDVAALKQDAMRPVDVPGAAKEVANWLHRASVSVHQLADVLVRRPPSIGDRRGDLPDLLKTHEQVVRENPVLAHLRALADAGGQEFPIA